jgi:hypothetical protein
MRGYFFLGEQKSEWISRDIPQYSENDQHYQKHPQQMWRELIY